MRKIDIIASNRPKSTISSEKSKNLFFFLEKRRVGSKNEHRFRKWQSLTHLGKLITFREIKCLIKVYVSAAVQLTLVGFTDRISEFSADFISFQDFMIFIAAKEKIVQCPPCNFFFELSSTPDQTQCVTIGRSNLGSNLGSTPRACETPIQKVFGAVFVAFMSGQKSSEN